MEGDHLCESVSNLSYYERPGCHLTNAQEGGYDTVAGIRIVTSLLGFIGATSIIVSVLFKRRIFNAEVHPIFMLSLADCILASLWIAGGFIWLSDPGVVDEKWCYTVTVLTTIMECVAVNLTLVYAIFAYIKTSRSDLNSILAHSNQKDISLKIIVLVYCIAWTLPIFITLLVFGITEGAIHFLSDTKDCSCWCLPTPININPFVSPVNKDTEIYIDRQESLAVGLGAVLISNYVIVFVALLVLYLKILKKIKKIRQEHDVLMFGEPPSCTNTSNYGTAEANRIIYGQSRARKRVVLFVTVFICSGFFNIILLISLLVVLTPHLEHEDHSDDFTPHPKNSHRHQVYLFFLCAQSLTLPLQGFMNAIVYGWTRDDFVQNIITQSPSELNNDFQQSDSTDGDQVRRIEESSIECSDERFQETLYPITSDED